MSVGRRGPNRRGRSSSFPFTPELGEQIIQDLLRGIPLTKAAARSSVPYATVTHWLARGRQIDGPLEWKRFAARVAWTRALVAQHEYEQLLDMIFPHLQDRGLGSRSLLDD